jgi:hypothetical protein
MKHLHSNFILVLRSIYTGVFDGKNARKSNSVAIEQHVLDTNAGKQLS